MFTECRNVRADTYHTFEWFFASMNFIVIGECAQLTKLFLADGALERFLAAYSHCDCTT